jgi:hypothetical protein
MYSLHKVEDKVFLHLIENHLIKKYYYVNPTDIFSTGIRKPKNWWSADISDVPTSFIAKFDTLEDIDNYFKLKLLMEG